jgi:hypothetical protein
MLVSGQNWMQVHCIAVVLLDDATVDLDAEVELAEERREVEVGIGTADIVLDHKELVAAAAHTESEEQLVDHTEPVADILEAVADIGLVDPEEGTVADREELDTHTADWVELLVAPVEGNHTVVVVVDVDLVGSDSTSDQVVPGLDILTVPEGAASTEVVVKS